MPRKPIVVVLAAGAALSLGAGCGPRSPGASRNPSASGPSTEGEAPPSPPPEPQHLPTWDQVTSSHPEGATNPPIPTLAVTPEGDCYKGWVSPFAAEPGRIRRVETDCSEDRCGTRIQCPPEADDLLAAWKAEHAEPPDDGEP